MIKNVLLLRNVELLSKKQQSNLMGGAVDKCCIRIPGNGIKSNDSWCNPKPECASSRCGC